MSLNEELYRKMILAFPECRHTALALATWLESNGDPRYELIEVQCELEVTEAWCSPKRRRLLEREEALLPEMRVAWGLRNGGRNIDFLHGLPLRIHHLPHMLNFFEENTPYEARKWLTAYTIKDWIGDHGAASLAQARMLRTFTALQLSNTGIGNKGAQALVEADNLQRIRRLEIGGNYFSDYWKCCLVARFGEGVVSFESSKANRSASLQTAG